MHPGPIQKSRVSTSHIHPLDKLVSRDLENLSSSLSEYCGACINGANEHLRALPTRIYIAARRPAIILLGLILLTGLALRLYFIEQWRPALVGFPDTTIYIQDALSGIFNNPLRVGGYSEFLRLMHGIRPHLSFVILVQHLLGLASGLLLFGAVRRAKLSQWVALLPAAVIMLGGSEIFVEHAPLSEALFIFLVDLALYSILRTWYNSLGWIIIAGIALGLATDVRSIGLILLVVLVVVGMLTSPRSRRTRLMMGLLMLLAAGLPIAWYLRAHEQSQGYGGFTGAGYFDLYARVAPFADCKKFKPPAGTTNLCIHIPRSRRPGHDAWEFTAMSPAVQAFGEPDFTVPKPGENSKLRAFAEAAILGQPLEYLEYVGRDLIRIIDPSYPSSPYGNKGPASVGYGNSPQQLTNYYFNAGDLPYIQHIIAAYYPGDGEIHKSVKFLIAYEQDTRIEGPFMALLILLALAAPILANARERRAAFFFFSVTIVLLIGPILLSEYDYRFTIPAFGPLAATAGIGAQAVGRHIRRLTVRP